MFPSACSLIVLVFTVSLHVSAYMAIFKHVGVFICLKDSASLFFFVCCLFYAVTLCMFSIYVLFLCCGWLQESVRTLRSEVFSTHPLLSTTRLSDFIVLTSLTRPRKIISVVLQISHRQLLWSPRD
jgi:hypothetical protein